MAARIIPYTSGEYKMFGDSLLYVPRVRCCEYEGQLITRGADKNFSTYNDIAEFLRENPCFKNIPIVGRGGSEDGPPFIMIPSREPVQKHSYIEFFHLNGKDMCIHTLYEILYDGNQIGWKYSTS